MIETPSTTVELKLSIDRLMRKLDFLYKHLRIEYPDESVPTYVLEARELVRQGRDTEAVKTIREQTAVGVLEARAIVEDMARKMGRSVQGFEPVAAITSEPIESVSIASPQDQAAVDAAWRAALRASDRS